MSPDEDFRLRPGRMRQGGARARTFVAQVVRAAMKAGYIPRRSGPARRAAIGRGRSGAIATALRSPTRRVIVKARIVRHRGSRYRAAPLGAHIGYLRREGVDREGAGGRLFDARGEADAQAFAGRCEGDRHHFRFIVSPEDAAQMESLQGFARELMRRAELDLGTSLDWVGVEHWNTAHPHLHILVRGADAAGADLVIDRDYIVRGLRGRAEALVSLELGPRTAREVAAGLERDATAERWTRLDDLMAAEAGGDRLDLRPGEGASDPMLRTMLAARAATLARLGLAVPDGPGAWRLDPDRQAQLRALAERGDIIATLHRVAGEGRAMAELAPYGEQSGAPILGRLLDRGLHDELTGRAYLVVDGVDGRVHHIRVADLALAGDTPPGGVVEVRAGGEGLRVAHRSDLAMRDQVTAQGSTWLDRQLVSRDPAVLAEGGFGADVRAALAERSAWLVDQGLATRGAAGRVTFRNDLLATLRERDLAAAGARLARLTGLAYRAEADGGRVEGQYSRRVDLASGRFAMVEDGLGFRLAPWAQALDRRLGQEVRGRLVPGGVDWDLGRTPGRSR